METTLGFSRCATTDIGFVLIGATSGKRPVRPRENIAHTYDREIVSRTPCETLPLTSHQTFSAVRLLRHAAPMLGSDFAGMGLVFYDSLAALPYLQLEVAGNERFERPVNGLGPIAKLLARTARRSSAWHDGFHFVHAGSGSLTSSLVRHLGQDGDEPAAGMSNREGLTLVNWPIAWSPAEEDCFRSGSTPKQERCSGPDQTAGIVVRC